LAYRVGAVRRFEIGRSRQAPTPALAVISLALPAINGVKLDACAVMKNFGVLALVALAFLAGLILTQSPGTVDVGNWLSWINAARTNGLAPGFVALHTRYPPLALTILHGAYELGRLVGLTEFTSIKLSILLFLWLSTFLVWLWTRNVSVALILYFSLLLNSLALGYIDIYFAPSLILSLWMLKERRLVGFSMFYTVACLTKWQPILIGPFIAIYLVGIQDDLGQWKHWMRRIGLQVVLPASAVTALTLAVFGALPVLHAFKAALSHTYLSGNALNLNWIVTYFLHTWRPNDFGGLRNGLATYITTKSWEITLIPRLLFYSTYLLTLLAFVRREKDFKNLVLFSIIGVLCYYTFNIGVNENHLFLVAILAVILLWLDEAYRSTAVLLILMSNINLFLFYGTDGTLHFDRLFLGIDTSLPLAFFNVLYFLCLFSWVLFAQAQPVAVISKRRG
jgi:hypothetical protein